MDKAGILSIFFFFLPAFTAFPQALALDEEKTFLLEDFEPAESKSLIERRWEVRQEDVLTPDCDCSGWLVPAIRNFEETTVLRLAYRPPATCAYSLKFKKADFSDWTDLNIHIKGDRFSGFPDTFEIQLSEGAFSANRKLSGITASWQKIAVPLDSFKKELRGCGQVDALKIIFKGSPLNNKEAILYIDDISFSGSESSRRLLSGYIDRGNRYCESGFYEAAIAEYKKVLRRAPGNIFAHTNLGVAYTKQQKYWI